MPADSFLVPTMAASFPPAAWWLVSLELPGDWVPLELPHCLLISSQLFVSLSTWPQTDALLPLALFLESILGHITYSFAVRPISCCFLLLLATVSIRRLVALAHNLTMHLFMSQSDLHLDQEDLGRLIPQHQARNGTKYWMWLAPRISLSALHLHALRSLVKLSLLASADLRPALKTVEAAYVQPTRSLHTPYVQPTCILRAAYTHPHIDSDQ
jgi:hypothetical protein